MDACLCQTLEGTTGIEMTCGIYRDGN